MQLALRNSVVYNVYICNDMLLCKVPGNQRTGDIAQSVPASSFMCLHT